MTVSEWEEAAEVARLAGQPLRIGPSEYAALVRLRLCRDPKTMADHSPVLFGAALVVT